MKKNFLILLFFISLNFIASASEIGIILRKQLIKPGTPLVLVVSQIGFPDWVKAVRGRSQNYDFIAFIYKEYALRLDIDNETNNLTAILLEDNLVKLNGIPFKIGDEIEKVIASWGEPELREKNVLCYYKKGVYIDLDYNKKIAKIYISTPGEEIKTIPALTS